MNLEKMNLEKMNLEKMNLEKMNLVELNAQEVKSVEGGFLPLLIIGVCLLLGGCAAQKAPVYKTP
jgi:lactobin A/cerein 7B family class IIb bacteriocin